MYGQNENRIAESEFSSEKIDLTNCDRELIHIPGAIQPHGVLLVLAEPDLRIVQISNNARAFLAREPEELLNQPLESCLDPQQVQLLQERRLQPDLEALNPLQITVHSTPQPEIFDGIIHRIGTRLILELEPFNPQIENPFSNFYHLMRSSTAVLQRARDLPILSQAAADLVRELTGFDRVMIYKFHPDWHGEVIAEAKREGLEPFLGLHYPASDIPQQARELYRHNWLRLIANVAYQPAALLSVDNPGPLDLSGSVLRSVSPMHIQYLKNMGVGASMSISILKNQQLWGLISCHHATERYVPYITRAACEFLGQILSLQIAAREELADNMYEMEVKTKQSILLDLLLQTERVEDVLQAQSERILQLVEAQGVAIYLADRYLASGKVPDQATGLRLLEWVRPQLHAEEFFATNALATLWEEGESIKEIASGVLVISISALQNSYLLWFRPEIIQQVTWGGDPEKPMQSDQQGIILHPRTSFAAWSQTVQRTATAWKRCEIEAALSLRSAIVDRVLRSLLLHRNEELASLNERLEESNQELDSFAYIVSHDLKEPLRGISNYVSILEEDYHDQLDETGIARLTTLTRLSARMGELIDALLHYSRVGRVELAFVQTDLNEVVQRSLEMVRGRIEEDSVQVHLIEPLPTIRCDRIRVGEIFSNLISNAIKYNDKPAKEIEIGALPEEEQDGMRRVTLYVRDNGIGIREKYFDSIFRIFKRLHGRDTFGGGTGAGLTIVKRIVERHSGNIWVESEPGRGSTFYFTLVER
ncbi:histidine kinase [Tengunoibacter tsumagoiensis]|uniref:histidine kinase n=1 Tax=Tengunoibacter tsumagoiensis TaxID=2014871 RepID=A0A402A2N8_9CHLR|nr:histidine kinase [Tengunoibacter tsumagoiensis]